MDSLHGDTVGDGCAGCLAHGACSDGAGNLRISCAGGYCARDDDDEVDEEVEVKFGDPEAGVCHDCAIASVANIDQD